MDEPETVTVELNDQQRRMVEAVREAGYPDLTLAELIHLGFREWGAGERLGKA